MTLAEVIDDAAARLEAAGVAFGHGIYALPYPNTPPVLDSTAVTSATAGAPYTYQVKAHDPDGAVVVYTLDSGPQGMSIDPGTGVLAWTPTAGAVHGMWCGRNPVVNDHVYLPVG